MLQILMPTLAFAGVLFMAWLIFSYDGRGYEARYRHVPVDTQHGETPLWRSISAESSSADGCAFEAAEEAMGDNDDIEPRLGNSHETHQLETHSSAHHHKPIVNIDGSLMVGDVDINGNLYGVTAFDSHDDHMHATCGSLDMDWSTTASCFEPSSSSASDSFSHD